MTALAFAELDGIATSMARQSDLGEDVRQEAWVRFLTYSPQNRAYAWRCANSASHDLHRRAATQQRLQSLTYADLSAAGWGARHDPVEPGTPEWKLLYNRVLHLYRRQAFPRWAARSRRQGRARMRRRALRQTM